MVGSLITESSEALFLHQVSSRWLTLPPYFEVVLKRWEDCRKYFLEFSPLLEEYKYHLPKDQRYHRIKKCGRKRKNV